MNSFLLDLWHDLREKRLWPIAALLLVATAAVPAVLLQKAQPAATPAPGATQGQAVADKLPTVTLDDIGNKVPSDLTAFKTSQRNPFKPLKDLPKVDKGANTTVTPSKKATAASGSGSASSSGSGSSAGNGGTSAGSGSSGGAASPVGPKTTYFTYRADISFGAPGKEKTTKQLETFSLLGDDKNPAAMFMGISDDHQYAVFTVDTARYESNGEHQCKPSDDRCELIYLKVAEDSNETTFTSLDGQTTYNLKILAIKRIVLDKAAVENVPTENKNPKPKSTGQPNKSDVLPTSLFDIFAKTR
ncbi:MAG: hypothetical protein QOJ12_80 [Thermoleophilales bacterium]|nr:hypothetical protein [Thermoleophilales bacterium]